MASEDSLSDPLKENKPAKIELEAANETTWLKSGAEYSGATWTGTITRGQKVGEMVQLQLTSEEVEAMQKSFTENQESKESGCQCGADSGPHILLLGILSIPVAFLLSAGLTFYHATITWYNVFLHFSDEKTFWHRLFIAPLLIVFYPLIILIAVLVIAIYAAFMQISWHFSKWWMEMKDLEKGACGLVCSVLKLESCSPYDVVILEKTLDLPQQAPPQRNITQSQL